MVVEPTHGIRFWIKAVGSGRIDHALYAVGSGSKKCVVFMFQVVYVQASMSRPFDSRNRWLIVHDSWPINKRN